ncbi:MAG: DUF4886 domain-containing protein [Oscillospiraceae bacterium]|nr:DUF4886 domain-containing protein [Oscillospiraceae bacterium]
MNKPLKVLCIGNSFSQDATRYLEGVASGGPVPLIARNLYIGGCSLERHANNLRRLAFEYEYQKDAVHMFKTIIPGRKNGVSIRMALEMDEWDVVTVQQVSQLSGIYESYFPYLSEVLSVVREKAPQAQIMFHSTWAYEIDSDHPHYGNYDRDQQKMYDAIQDVTARISSEFGLPVLPTGRLIQTLRGLKPFDYAGGGLSLNRDGFHLSPYGRYAAALLWYKQLTGCSVKDNTFVPEGLDISLAALIRKTVDDFPIEIKEEEK